MKGCICPPTSEQTCKAYDCPRQMTQCGARAVGPLDPVSWDMGVIALRSELLRHAIKNGVPWLTEGGKAELNVIADSLLKTKF